MVVGYVHLDVTKPEGEGWMSRICRFLRCNKQGRLGAPSLPNDAEAAAYYSNPDEIEEALNQFGGDQYYRDAEVDLCTQLLLLSQLQNNSYATLKH